MSKHTPTPWRNVNGKCIIPAAHADRKIGGATDMKQDREEFAHVICWVERNRNRFTAEQADANTAFIVKAVNNHDQLVRALRAAKALFAALDIDIMDCADYGNGEHAYKTIEAINEALAAVEA